MVWGVSSESRQAVHCLLVSLQKDKPNQSAHSLLNGGVGRVAASLIGFRGAPGDSDALFTASLVAKLENEGFVDFNSALDLVVLRHPVSGTISDFRRKLLRS